MRSRILTAIALVLLARAGAAAEPAASERVLVVVNGYERDSKRVAAHYLAVRGIPEANRCVVKPFSKDSDGTTTITWEEFDEHLRPEIRKCVQRVGAAKVLYIVLSYLMPFRVSGAPAGTGVSLDSHLSDLWGEVPGQGRAMNPYFAAVRDRQNIFPPRSSLAEYRVTPYAARIYSVWRLDGRSAAAATALVDKAFAAERSGASGIVCFDRRFGDDIRNQPDSGHNLGDWELLRAAEQARAAGLNVIEDTHAEEFGTAPAPARCDQAIFYAGWYALNHYNDAFTWNDGAIGIHLDSLSLINPREGDSWSAGALARGISVTSGAIDEPFLEGLPRPATILNALLGDATVGDAFLRGTLWLRWQIVNVGDPLYRPFSQSARKKSASNPN